MAYDDLTPSNRFEMALSGDMTAEEASNRLEKILAGADIEPSNRLEYFLKLRVSDGGGGGGGGDTGTMKLLSSTPLTGSQAEITIDPSFASYKVLSFVVEIENYDNWVYLDFGTTMGQNAYFEKGLDNPDSTLIRTFDNKWRGYKPQQGTSYAVSFNDLPSELVISYYREDFPSGVVLNIYGSNY